MSNNDKVYADEWTVKEGGFKPVPSGSYLAEFKGVEDRELPDGMRWRWAWTIKSGEHSGNDATALTAQKITAGSHAGRIISGLIGKELKAGDNVKSLIQDCVGKAYLVSVQSGAKGGKPSVQFVSKPPAM